MCDTKTYENNLVKSLKHRISDATLPHSYLCTTQRLQIIVIICFFIVSSAKCNLQSSTFPSTPWLMLLLVLRKNRVNQILW